MNNNYKTALEDYKEWKDQLKTIFEVEGTDELFGYLEDRGFTTLPASLNHHLSYQGGLLIHSMNVIDALIELTESLGLTWQDSRSPIIVGLCHDLCKLEFYKSEVNYDPRGGETVRFEHNDNPELDFGGHGMLSLVIAQQHIQLTEEEMYCIRFHMGAYEQKDWSKFDAAIRKYPNVLYTHTADMIASKIMER